jgi:tetratricopeptide (TPR) repeat protein
MRIAVALFVTWWCALPALADRASDAREHYQSATAHFAVGEFAEAATDYQEAFKLKPDPALLYNAAQSYRLAGKPERALILYKNYLQLYPSESNVEQVREQIAKLQETIASASRAKPPETGPAPEPAHPQPSVTPPEISAPPPTTTASTPATEAVVEKRATPVYRKWWLWTIVGVVAAGGAVTAAVLLTRPNNWSNAPEVGPGSSNALVRW